MSEQDLSNLDDPSLDGGEGFDGEPADDGWSPVMGTPPPGTEAVVDPVDVVPPHEVDDGGLVPPPPAADDPTADLTPPPPPDTSTELPPELPPLEDPVDLGVTPGDAPMPPGIDGAEAPPPPPPGDGVALDDGPPLPPAVEGTDPSGQSPVPPMGTSATVTEGAVDLDLGDGAPLVPPGTDTAAATPAAASADALGGDVNLSAAPGDLGVAPPMGTQPATDPATRQPGDLGVAPPMGTQPATDPATDPLTEPATDPGTVTDPGTPTDEAPAPAPETTVPEGSVPVAPGAERLTASALTGWYLDSMDANDPMRDRMVDLVEQYAADGEITMAELQAAFEEAGMTTTTDGQSKTLNGLVDRAAPTACIATTSEGTGVYRLSRAPGGIEMESMRTGAVYAAEPEALARSWRESGSTVIAPPAPEAPASTQDTERVSKATDAEGGNQLRNVFVAGAILLPMAGGAAYLATRKLR